MKNYILFFLFLLSSQYLISQKYSQPESVVYDAKRNCYYISNVGVQGTFDGQIIKRNPNGTLEYLVSTNVLQDPKGMYIVGDTLFVADNYKLYYINLLTRTVVGSTTLGTPDIFLNDIVADDYGFIYISDTYKSNIFKVKASKPNEFEKLSFLGSLSNANGMYYDKENKRILIVTYQQNALIMALSLETFQISVVRNSSLNYLDGITRDKEGNYYVSAWGNNLGGIYKYDKNLTEPPSLVYGSLNGPADILMDTVNNVLVIPEMGANRVHFISFTDVLNPPNLVFPPDGTTGLGKNVELRFSRVFEALNYDVQVSEDENFTNIVFSQKTVDTMIVARIDKASTKYYWRVRSNTLTKQSEWSNVWSFTSVTKFFDTPQPIQPANGDLRVPRQPTFVWTKSAQALYKLQIWTNSEAKGNPVVEVSNITDTVYKLTVNLQMLETYYWRVQAFSGYSNSDWSEMFMFKVNENVPNAPLLYSPQNEQKNVSLTPTLVWQKTDAAFYRLQLSRTSNFNDIVIDISDLTDTTYTVIQPLQENTRYWWRVRAYTSSQGRWSEVYSFTTLGSTSIFSENNSELSFFPNPAYDLINIASNINIQEISIANLNGQILTTYNINGQNSSSIDISWLNNGNYFLIIKSNSEIYLKKFIVAK